MSKFGANLCTGKLHIECKGEQLQEWFQHVVREKIECTQTVWISEQKMELIIRLRDFYRVVALLRQYRLRMKILKRIGGTFYIGQARKRKFFIVGFVLFVILLISMSSFIWRVDIVGNERIPDEVVRRTLLKSGIFVGKMKFALPEQEQVQHQLLAQLPDASWIGYRIEGTRALIMIVEKKKIEQQQDEIPSQGPVHLIASKGALVREMKVLRGYPQVEILDMVIKGQRLVSGIYGDDGQDKGRVVGAQGKVWGEVWYESEVSMPLKQSQELYTGRREHRFFPYLGSFTLRWDWFARPEFSQFATIPHIEPVFLLGEQMPFGLIREDYLETEQRNQRLTTMQAIQLVRRQAREECQKMIGLDGRIIVEKVLHRSVESGKVYLKLHFDVIENIAIPQPILQGE